MLPLAPDLTIIYIGFKSSKLSSIAWLIFLVASSQTLITELYLSSFVINPLAYCFLIVSICLSASSSNPFLAAGTLTSLIENVIPASVEYLNPKAFI